MVCRPLLPVVREMQFLFLKNVFCNNIEPEIFEILRISFKNKPEADILKRK